MTDDKRPLTINMTDEIRAQIEADPKLAAAVRDWQAKMHQAHDAVQRGQYKTMEDAMEALTGHRPVKIDPATGEQIPGASLNRDMGLNTDDDDDS